MDKYLKRKDVLKKLKDVSKLADGKTGRTVVAMFRASLEGIPYITVKDQTNRNDIVAVIRCKDCDFWNAWDKHGDLCSCAHFTLDDSKPVYTKPDDFCSCAEKK